MGGLQRAIGRLGVALVVSLVAFGSVSVATTGAAVAASDVTYLRPTFSFDANTGTMTITAPASAQDEFTVFLAQKADHTPRIAVTDDGFIVDAVGDPSSDYALGGFQRPANANCGTGDVYDGSDLVQNEDDDTALVHCDATKVHKVVIFGGDRADSFDVASDDPADNVPSNITVEMHGGPGPDEFDGGYTNDIVYGDTGADTYNAADDNDGADYVDLGADTDSDPDSRTAGNRDTVDYSFSTAVTVKLNANSETNPAGDHDTLLNIEKVIGTDAADEIWGNDNPNISDDLEGDGGNDNIRGFGGDDELFGGNDNDTLWGGAGADYIEGGNGTDTVSYDDHNIGVSVDLQRRTAEGSAEDRNADIDYSVENIVGTSKNDVLLGDSNANEIHGGAGTDLINGRSGGDKIYGEGDPDMIDARDGITDPVIDCGNSPGGEVVLFDAGIEHPVGCPPPPPAATVEVVVVNGVRTMRLTAPVGMSGLAWTTKSDGTIAYGYASTTPLTGYIQSYGTNPAPIAPGSGCTAVPNHTIRCGNVSAIQMVGSNSADYFYALAALPTAVWGNGGADNITLNSTPGAIAGGAGNDTIYTRETLAQLVDCGADYDTIRADPRDVFANCEIRDVH